MDVSTLFPIYSLFITKSVARGHFCPPPLSHTIGLTVSHVQVCAFTIMCLCVQMMLIRFPSQTTCSSFVLEDNHNT